MTLANQTRAPSGYFGEYGGVFVPETLVGALEALEHYRRLRPDDVLAQIDDALAIFAEALAAAR